MDVEAAGFRFLEKSNQIQPKKLLNTHGTYRGERVISTREQ